MEVYHISCLAVFERYKILRNLRLISLKDVYEENKEGFWIMIIGLRHDLDTVYGLRWGLPKIVSIERKYGVRSTLFAHAEILIIFVFSREVVRV